MTPLDGQDVHPGDLVRAAASTLGEESRDAPVPGARSPDPQPRSRILVVDDNQDVRGLICRQLAGVDRYEVVGEAADGEEAVQAAAALQPQVVLLDLAMPRMDGLQALPLVLAAVEGVRVIVMSGFAGAAMADTVLAAGAARYVEKGLRMDLLAVIDDVLRPRAGTES